MADEHGTQADSTRRALLTIQAALNILICDGLLTKKAVLESINNVFSPPVESDRQVAVEHPSEAHAILSGFVLGLTRDPEPIVQPTMEI